MFALNTPPIGAYPDTSDNAQYPTPIRLRCTCGDCAECGSTSALPLVATPADGEASPTAGAGDDAEVLQHAEHQHASNHGASAIESGVMPWNAQAAVLAPTSPTRTQGGPRAAARGFGERVSNPISHAAMTAAMTKFESIAGQMYLAQATPEVVKQFVEGLRREGKSESTVLRYLRAMKAVTQLLGAFEQSGTGHSNPFAQAAELIRPSAPSFEQVPPFALEKLQRLLSSPSYLAMKDAEEPHRAARFWVPLLCLCTYARPRELMRLQVSELERHQDAWVLRVSSTMQRDPQTGGPAMRWVPLHEELVRCGFVSYVAQRKLNGHDWLFGPGSKAETLSASEYRVSHWFSAHCQTLGLGKECNLHALRRAFIAACIRSGFTDDGIRLLTSRTAEIPASWRLRPSAVSHTDALDQAVAWVRRLRFEGLELSHLYVDDPLGPASEVFPTR